MTDSLKSYAYTLSILFTAMLVRGLVGLSHPDLDLAATALTGAMTVLLLAPILYRMVYGQTLLTNRQLQLKYFCLATLSVGGFGYYVL